MRPETEADLAEIIAAARGPFHIRGGGTRGIGKPVAAEVLETGALSGITLYEPGALTLVARAGTPLAEIEAALETGGQRLAFEPMDHRVLLGSVGEPTIGGAVAGNVSGPRRVQAGACRDFMLGVRFVDGAGRIVKNGGRVMKNVTGYDLVKLMTGSWGTLGVLTEVALKVLPRPETEATVVLHGLDPQRAVAAMAAALGSPFEVSGAAHLPDAAGSAPETMLRIEGFAASVAYRAERLTALLGDRVGIGLIDDAEQSRAAWRGVRDVAPLADRSGDVWRLSVRPSDAPGILERIGGDASVMLDWGGGLIWVLVPEGTDLRARLGSFGGHATLIRAGAATRAALPVFQPEAAAVAALSKGLKARFDPRGLLNPGLMEA